MEFDSKVQKEITEHTKSVQSLQQKLSASEVLARTLSSQNKNLEGQLKDANAHKQDPT